MIHFKHLQHMTRQKHNFQKFCMSPAHSTKLTTSFKNQLKIIINYFENENKEIPIYFNKHKIVSLKVHMLC